MSNVICMNCGAVIEKGVCRACMRDKVVEQCDRLFEEAAMTMQDAVRSFGQPGFKNPFSRSLLKAHESLRPSE